ncbi:hypothetical protein ACWGID_12750 [Kribbella sp. NPDC054772]
MARAPPRDHRRTAVQSTVRAHAKKRWWLVWPPSALPGGRPFGAVALTALLYWIPALLIGGTLLFLRWRGWFTERHAEAGPASRTG